MKAILILKPKALRALTLTPGRSISGVERGPCISEERYQVAAW